MNSGTLTSLPGLERGRLGAPARPVALEPRLGHRDRQLDRRRDLDADDLAVVERDLGDHLLDEVVLGVAEGDLGDVRLVVGLRVHEHVVVAVVVQVLHVLALDDRLLDLDPGVERLVDHGAGPHVADLRADERAALARLDVLELDDLEQVVVELERDAVLQVVHGDLGHVQFNSRFG